MEVAKADIDKNTRVIKSPKRGGKRDTKGKKGRQKGNDRSENSDYEVKHSLVSQMCVLQRIGKEGGG